mgnify:FL=1
MKKKKFTILVGVVNFFFIFCKMIVYDFITFMDIH